MHIDANSAFLSWSSAEALKNGSDIDYRKIPAVVGGDESSRHGIVLAASVPAKKAGIRTAETLVEARRKCPGLVVLPPDFELYQRYSDAMYKILSDYTPVIQRYSIDECFIDYTHSQQAFGEPLKVAWEISRRMKEELGFTVNIGVSVNKILAKMGSELEKPDKIHTLYPEEIEKKMWPLDVGELFMVGRKSSGKLKKLGIYTIGDLAHADVDMLVSNFGTYAYMMHDYANGIDEEEVDTGEDYVQKGFGNASTIDHNVKDTDEAHKYLLKMCDKVSERLRRHDCKASLVSVSIRYSDLQFSGRQKQLDYYLDSTMQLYRAALEIFDSLWNGYPIRQIGVSASALRYNSDSSEVCEQIGFFDVPKEDDKTDKTMDEIKKRFGSDSIKRGSLLGMKSGHPHEGK